MTAPVSAAPSVSGEPAKFDLSDYLMSFRDVNDWRVISNDSFPLAKRIVCKDGFSLSVQATHGAYCSPRNNIGPWYQVEVGFPSAKPELIAEYAEQPEKPTDTVYGYVPVSLVEELIALHGGPATKDEQIEILKKQVWDLKDQLAAAPTAIESIQQDAQALRDALSGILEVMPVLPLNLGSYGMDAKYNAALVAARTALGRTV